MNSLILSLAPFSGLATALPAIAAAASPVTSFRSEGEGEARSFAPEVTDALVAERERNGGYLLL